MISKGKKILVVGGVAGGASFVARMRRLDEEASIIMFEKGEYISFANCGLPYHIGGSIPDRRSLIIQTPQRFSERFNVEVRTETEVVAVDAGRKTVTAIADGSTYEESFDHLVLAPGAKPVRPPIAGIENEKVVSLRTIADMDRIIANIKSGFLGDVMVVGGGFIGLEMVENLAAKGIKVTLVEASDQIFAPADMEMASVLREHVVMNGVDVKLGDSVQKFSNTVEGKIRAELKSGDAVDAALVILAIGVKPDTAFLEGSGIQTNQFGAIVVDDSLLTNMEGVYAVGDAVEVRHLVSGARVNIPLAGPANRQGRIVADNIAGIASRYKDSQGTSICKLFDMTAAVTGINEKTAVNLGIDYLKSYTHSPDHASYYPGASPMAVKIIFSPKDGKLLGAQITGSKGVDKRIDIFATAIRHQLTVDDLGELELAYAPPYGSAKDPVNIAGFVAQNILNGLSPVFYAENVQVLQQKGEQIVDVRTVPEWEHGAIEGAVNIPLNELRSRLDELDKNRNVVVYCQVGLRGHLATRILLQNGFRAVNLSGGFTTYRAYTDEQKETAVLTVSPKTPVKSDSLVTIDACGLQCPGPVMKLREAIDSATDGQAIQIKATDQGFAADIPSWCSRTGHKLVSLAAENGVYSATVKKGGAVQSACSPEPDRGANKTMVIFSNDFDKMVAAFIIANGAVSMGSNVTLFFTFWGLNLLRKDNKVKVKKSIVERMFGMMMPRGPEKLTLSKMNMGGMGSVMIRSIMKKKNVYSLPVLMEEAMKSGIKFVACAMSMDIMGIKKEELIDGVEYGGVAAYLAEADNSNYNLFI